MTHPGRLQTAKTSKRSSGSGASILKPRPASSDPGSMPNDLMIAPAGARRLVTRSDFDGLVCAALLKELGILDDILFVHPKDVQDGKVQLTDRDITTNLPYVPGVHLSFDHHDSETIRVEDSPENHVIVAGAKSAAR